MEELVTEITSKQQDQLPPFYVSFAGTLEYGLTRVEEITEQLKSRGLEVVRPKNIFHVKFGSDTDHPWYQYVFEVKKIGDTE